LLRREAIRERTTPDHPDTGTGTGGPVEHINGPKINSEYARGSVEWQRNQQEKTDAPS
jgi:hypothetical protein